MLAMKCLFMLLFLLTAGLGLQAQRSPEWMFALRDAVYEQVLMADEIRPLYLETRATAEKYSDGANRYLALSRAEYLMGLALFLEGRDLEARTHLHEGLRLAEIAVETTPSAEAWGLRAENLALLLEVNPWTFTLANGPNVERFARNALELDGRNATARHIMAARWIFAPRLFANINRGREMMKAILDEADMERDDLFNVTLAIGRSYVLQRRYDEARYWVLRSLQVYPTNRLAAEVLKTVDAGRGRRRSR